MGGCKTLSTCKQVGFHSVRRIIKKEGKELSVTGTEVFETCPKCQSGSGLPRTTTLPFPYASQLPAHCIVLFDSVYDYRIGVELPSVLATCCATVAAAASHHLRTPSSSLASLYHIPYSTSVCPHCVSCQILRDNSRI